MRIVLLAAVGLILGLGAGGGLGGMKTKGQILQVRADSLEHALADSALAATHGAEEEVDGHEGAEDASDPDGHEPDQDPGAETDGAEHGQGGEDVVDPGAHGASDATPAPPPTQPTVAQVEDQLDEKTGLERLGRIFMAMKARDAAAVLTHLNDKEVEAILFELREKQAAEILGNFPPDRAAVLSRSVLQKSGGAQ